MNPFEAETNDIRARGEQALGALREKQKDLEGYKEKADTLIDTISGVVTGVGATAGAVGAGVAKGGKALAGAAKIIRKGISRQAARLAEDGEGAEAEGVDLGEAIRVPVGEAMANLQRGYAAQAVRIAPRVAAAGEAGGAEAGDGVAAAADVADAVVAGGGGVDAGAAAAAAVAANAGDAVVGVVGTTAAESVAGGLEAAGLALDASGVGVVAGITVGVVGGLVALGGLVSDIYGGVKGGIDAGTARAAGLADDAKQAMISSVTQNAPTAGSFVIPSMNGASLAHLPSSMSHA